MTETHVIVTHSVERFYLFEFALNVLALSKSISQMMLISLQNSLQKGFVDLHTRYIHMKYEIALPKLKSEDLIDLRRALSQWKVV